MVFVTSPFAFVKTPGRAIGETEELGRGDGVGEISAGFVEIGVGEIVTTGS